MLNPMSEPDRSLPPLTATPPTEMTATTIQPKLGRVRSGSRIRRDPSGLWPRLALASIIMHGVILTIVLSVSYRASEARRASLGRNDGTDRDPIAIKLVASTNNGTGKPTGSDSAANVPPTASPMVPSIQPSIAANPPQTPNEVTDSVDPNPNISPPSNPSPTPSSTVTPTPTPTPTTNTNDQNESGASSDPGNPGGNPADGSTETSGGNPDGSPTGNDSGDDETGSPNGSGDDPSTSIGTDRLGLIIRLNPLASDNPDPDRRPAQLTAPAANIDLPVNADPALLPDSLTIPFAIKLQVELSIDPNGMPSLVRVLEPDRDRELPQFEPFIAALIEGWRFDAASSAANGREVDQLDLLLALQWR